MSAPKFAVCQFYKDGNVFPVRLSIPTQGEAAQLRAWMKLGSGAVEDWRVVPMAELKPLLHAGKVALDGFTPEAQAKKRAEIENAEVAK